MMLEILPATLQDLSTILDLQKACYQTEAELHNEFNIPPLMQSQESIEADFGIGVSFLKGLVDGQLVASVRGSIIDNTAHIGRLIVKREFENNKFGQAMMRAIEMKLNTCSRYELFTGFKSERNIYLYEKLGYTEFKRQVINEKLTLVYLEKRSTR